jgi:hydrogenase maturation protease
LIVVGVGNRWRRDDAVGLVVARSVDGIEHEGDCARLLHLWDGDDDVVIVDAAAAAGAAGTVHRLDPRAQPLPASLLSSSTHAFGVADAIELARGLGRLPRSLRVYAIEGASFELGQGLSPAVEHAAGEVADELRARRTT